jgi:Tol biopolymer transport system component
MTDRADFEDVLGGWLAESAPAAEPPHLLERVLTQTARTARRPSWWGTGLRRATWVGEGAVALPRTLAAVASLALLVVLGLALVLAGGARPRVPLPPGLPGLIVGAREGELWLFDSAGDAHGSVATGEFLGLGAWSTDGLRLARFGGTIASPILVISTAKLDDVVLSLPLPAGAVPDLTWSPDGRRIAFGVDRDGLVAIYVVDVTPGATALRLTDPALEARVPRWSPDGSLIAFRGGVAIDQLALYVIRPDGTDTLRLSQSGRAVETACGGGSWSPSGNSIVFDTRYAGAWSVDADGSNERQIIGGYTEAHCAAVAPDGTRIAVVVSTQSGNEIQVMGIDGSGVVIPAQPLADYFRPIWSPDGREIASNGRTLMGGPAPRSFLDAAGVRPERTFHVLDTYLVDWQRLPPR